MSQNSRSQYISHQLSTSGLLSIQELSLLTIINSRPHYCLENLSELARMMTRSVRTVQRTIEKLVSKGIIKRTYTTFKRLKLEIVAMSKQNDLLNGGLIAQVFKYCAFKKKKKIRHLDSTNHDSLHDITYLSGINMTTMSESINRSNENKSILPDFVKKMGKSLKTEQEFMLEKQRQIAEFRKLQEI